MCRKCCTRTLIVEGKKKAKLNKSHKLFKTHIGNTGNNTQSTKSRHKVSTKHTITMYTSPAQQKQIPNADRQQVYNIFIKKEGILHICKLNT